MSKFNFENKVDKEFIEKEIMRFNLSRRRRDISDGNRYYKGDHDILRKKREVIGEGGELTEITHLPNNRIVNNQYKKMVDQKCNYLCGQPLTFRCDDANYLQKLNCFKSKKFMRTLKNICEDSLKAGVGWLYVHYNNNKLDFKRLNPYEVIAGWADDDHTKLDYAIRCYEQLDYSEQHNGSGADGVVVKKVEVYDDNGVHFFTLDSGRLTASEPYHQNYFTVGATGYNWEKIPLVPFKRNSLETPLINQVKSLQDGLNTILSNFQNNMEQDAHNTILVLVNYDGENLGQFRKNLATYGAVKVKTVDGAAGDLRTLQVEVNAANYEALLDVFKKAIIENAMGYDAKDDRVSVNANQLNIMSMYSDIDLDANSMETEFQASFEDLLWFVNADLANRETTDYSAITVEVIFNRDMLMNEGEIVDSCVKAVGLLSTETIIANHPWVTDVNAEIRRIGAQPATPKT